MATEVGLVKDATQTVLGIGEVSIDNFTFKLFYKWSVSLFITGSVAVGSSQFFGDPLKCEISREFDFMADDSADEDVVTNYCWMYSTFNIPPDFKAFCTNRSFGKTNLYNTYYQWVSVFLMIQAIIFYVPRCIWLSVEGGLMTFLAKGHQGRVVEDHSEKLVKLLDHYIEHVHNKFNKYAIYFFFCELLNIVILVSQIYATHVFLHHQFLDYGYQVYRYYRLPIEERMLSTTLDPMCEVFPKVSTCNYHRWGRAGGQETKNAICILSLNMINDKVFAVLWFWHCILIIAGIIRLVTRTIQFSSSSIRFFLMKTQMHRYLSKNKHAKHIQHYLVHCSIGDWFVLYQMNKNINKRFFAEFLALLSIKVNPDPHVRADPEIDILKEEDDFANGDIENFYDEEELEKNQEKLKQKVKWRRGVNMFTRKRHLTKKRK